MEIKIGFTEQLTNNRFSTNINQTKNQLNLTTKTTTNHVHLYIPNPTKK